MTILAEKTKVGAAHTKFKGLRTAIPWSFVQDWKLEAGDYLVWERKVMDNQMVVVIGIEKGQKSKKSAK